MSMVLSFQMQGTSIALFTLVAPRTETHCCIASVYLLYQLNLMQTGAPLLPQPFPGLDPHVSPGNIGGWDSFTWLQQW